MERKRPEDLGSHRWGRLNSLRSFGRCSHNAQMVYGRPDYSGKPVIAIINTWRTSIPCHTHLKQRAEKVNSGA